MSDSFHRNVNLEKELNALQARMDNKMNELQVSANDFFMFFFFLLLLFTFSCVTVVGINIIFFI